MGSQLPWFPALVGTLHGDFGPLLSEEGQKESSTQRSTTAEREPAPAVSALKCLHVVSLVRGCPCLSEPPWGQELKPQPAGACREGERDEVSSPGAAGPSCAQRVAETKDPTPLSEEQGRPQGNLGPQREGTRNALVTILTPTASSAHAREGGKLGITLRSCLMPNRLLEPGVTE